MNINIVSEFVTDLLAETGATPEETPLYQKLHDSLVERVSSRTFLEIVKLLTPEQAARLRAELDKETPNPEALFAKMSEEIPNLSSLLIQILAKIRIELLEEFTVKA